MISTAVIDAALIKELGSFFSTEAHKTTDRVRYINSAVRSIALAKNFSFNRYKQDITTISWTTDYTVPFQIETFAILDSAWNEIEILDFDDYYIRKNKDNVIWIWDDTMVTTMVWTFTILYRWFPTTITDLNWTISIPEHFFDIVLVKAASFWFADIKDYIKQNQKESIFNWMIKTMATRNSNRKPRNIDMVWSDQAWW